MSSVNLNRQKKINEQMKEVMDDFDRFEYFFASHWKHIVYAAIAVVVVVAAIVSVKYFVNKSSDAAAAAYDKAEDIAQLEKAIKDMYRMDKYKREALYYLGNAAELAGDTEKAVDCYRKILASMANYRDVPQRMAVLAPAGEADSSQAQ